jgi:hypothetical protein
MDGAEVCILEQANQVSLSGLLQRENRRRLKLQIGLEILSNLADKALEGESPDEELGALLVLADLTKCHGSWPIAVGPLHPPFGGRALANTPTNTREYTRGNNWSRQDPTQTTQRNVEGGLASPVRPGYKTTQQRIHPNTHAATTGQERIQRTQRNAPNATHRAALVASCLRGAFPPVLLLAVCLVRAILCAVFGAGSKFKERKRAFFWRGRLFFLLCVITFILPCLLLPHIWLFFEQNLKIDKRTTVV